VSLRFHPGSPLDEQPHYVYTFWRGSMPLYVGCTNDLTRRMKEHARSWPFLNRDATWIAWSVFPNREAGLTAEAERIAKLMPRVNVRDNPGRQQVSAAYANWEAHLEWEAEMDAWESKFARHEAVA
jgi:predicted GIY-YIG superfamily endonuclease